MKAYIFDLDGTIANTLEDITCAVNTMLISYSFPIFTTDEIRERIGKGARNLISRALPEDKVEDEAFFQEALEKYQKCYDTCCLDRVSLYDGVFEAVTRLRENGVKLAVLTNKDHRHAQPIVEKLLPGTFDIVLGYDSSFPHKPDPTAVRYIMKELGVSESETAFVGDSRVDVETARNAGVLSVGVSWGFAGLGAFDKTPPDLIITKAEELLLV